MNSRAFTTVELLVATALSVTLMVGLLRVVGAVQQDVARLKNHSSNDWSIALVEALRRDLVHAQTISQNEIGLTLVGYGSLDRRGFRIKKEDAISDLSSGHQPVRVTYRIEKEGSHSWLVRQQTDLDVLSNRNTWSELVCTGIDSFRLEPEAVANEAVELISNAMNVWLQQPGPVPNRVKLIVQLSNKEDIGIDQTLVLR